MQIPRCADFVCPSSNPVVNPPEVTECDITGLQLLISGCNNVPGIVWKAGRVAGMLASVETDLEGVDELLAGIDRSAFAPVTGGATCETPLASDHIKSHGVGRTILDNRRASLIMDIAAVVRHSDCEYRERPSGASVKAPSAVAC